jgi:hypothetical protein
VTVGIVTRSVRILFSHSTESRPAEGASNDDRSSVRAGLPRAIAWATSRLRPPTCRTSAVPRFRPRAADELQRFARDAQRRVLAPGRKCGHAEAPKKPIAPASICRKPLQTTYAGGGTRTPDTRIMIPLL